MDHFVARERVTALVTMCKACVTPPRPAFLSRCLSRRPCRVRATSSSRSCSCSYARADLPLPRIQLLAGSPSQPRHVPARLRHGPGSARVPREPPRGAVQTLPARYAARRPPARRQARQWAARRSARQVSGVGPQGADLTGRFLLSLDLSDRCRCRCSAPPSRCLGRSRVLGRQSCPPPLSLSLPVCNLASSHIAEHISPRSLQLVPSKRANLLDASASSPPRPLCPPRRPQDLVLALRPPLALARPGRVLGRARRQARPRVLLARGGAERDAAPQRGERRGG